MSFLCSLEISLTVMPSVHLRGPLRDKNKPGTLAPTQAHAAPIPCLLPFSEVRAIVQGFVHAARFFSFPKIIVSARGGRFKGGPSNIAGHPQCCSVELISVLQTI